MAYGRVNVRQRLTDFVARRLAVQQAPLISFGTGQSRDQSGGDQRRAARYLQLICGALFADVTTSVNITD